MIFVSPSGRYPYGRASSTSSRAFATTRLLRGDPGHRPPAAVELHQPLLPQRPQRSEHRVAIDLQRRSPEPASPSAIARRMAAATCSCRSTGNSSASWEDARHLPVEDESQRWSSRQRSADEGGERTHMPERTP